MQVQVNSDSSVHMDAALRDGVAGTVATALARFGNRITRVEVHLSDVNGHKAGIDKRCLMEARPSGHEPVAVTAHGGSVHEVVKESAEKLQRSLHTVFARLAKNDRAATTKDSMP